MPRRNRNANRTHSKHRRGWRITPLSEQAWVRAMNPRFDEQAGSAKVDAVVVLACVIAISVTALVLMVGWFAPASAKAIEITGPVDNYPTEARNPFIWVEHVQGRWHYAERADNSEWMVTRCRYEDSRNCYWNAKHRGNKRGKSFINLRGEIIRVVYRMQP